MALNDVTFKRNIKGLGAALPGQDFISGITFYTATPPSLFPSNVTSGGIVKCFQVQDAEAVGIVNDFSDETKASGTFTITAVGAISDSISVYTQEPVNNVLLATFVKTAAETTVTLLAAAIVAAINVNTITNGGYTATNIAGAITIVARPGLGIFLNSGTPLSTVIVGTITRGSITQYSGGVASKFAIYHYHIAEFFRMSPQGILYVGIFALPLSLTVPTYAEITTMQQFANGSIRQCGIYADWNAFLVAFVTLANAVANTLDLNKMPLSLEIGAEVSGSTLSTLSSTDLSQLNSEWVSVTIGQDGAATGFNLYKAYGKSITDLGALLGTTSAAKVSQSVADGTAFNISDGSENEVAAFANGVLFSATATSLLTALNNSRWIFVRKETGVNGTYFNDSHCAILQNNAYAYIYQNRTVGKIERLLNAAYFPFVSSQLLLNTDGTLANTSVAALESVGEQALDVMVQNQEISGKKITINPAQNVVATNKLVVTLNEVPVLIINNIEVDINQVLSL